MSEENKRTQYVGLYVTKEVEKEIKEAQTNDEIKEKIIKRFISSEEEWLEEEIREIDEYTIKYKAKLIGIKDAFGKAQDSYVEEIESIYEKANSTFKKVDKLNSDLMEKSKKAYDSLSLVKKGIENISIYSLENMISVVERYSRMSEDEKGLVKMLLDNK